VSDAERPDVATEADLPADDVETELAEARRKAE
jgi:hypothetical protein